MKNVCLTIRHCPVEVHRALKARARANHRNLNAETVQILSQSVGGAHSLSEPELLKTIRSLPLRVKFSVAETRRAVREGRK